MAIRADFAQLNSVHGQVESILSQLNSTLNADQEIINSIASNIQNDGMTGILKNYAEGNTQQGQELAQNLQKMDEFLVQQIQEYKAANEEAADELSSIDGMLEGIGDGVGKVGASIASGVAGWFN